MQFKPIPTNRNRRPAYSYNNALRFLPFFKKALENPGVDLFLSCDTLGIKLNTLQNRTSEALLWFTNNELEPEICKYRKPDFQRLRGIVKLKAGQVDGKYGVLLTFKRGDCYDPNEIPEIKEADITELGISNLNDTGEVIWKVRFMAWLESSEETFILEGARELGRVLNAEDIEWIKRTCLTADIECDVAATHIRAIKGS